MAESITHNPDVVSNVAPKEERVDVGLGQLSPEKKAEASEVSSEITKKLQGGESTRGIFQRILNFRSSRGEASTPTNEGSPMGIASKEKDSSGETSEEGKEDAFDPQEKLADEDGRLGVLSSISERARTAAYGMMLMGALAMGEGMLNKAYTQEAKPRASTSESIGTEAKKMIKEMGNAALKQYLESNKGGNEAKEESREDKIRDKAVDVYKMLNTNEFTDAAGMQSYLESVTKNFGSSLGEKVTDDEIGDYWTKSGLGPKLGEVINHVHPNMDKLPEEGPLKENLDLLKKAVRDLKNPPPGSQ